MIAQGSPVHALRLLLLSGDHAWREAAGEVVSATGAGTLEFAGNPADALARLMGAAHPYTHVLLDLAELGAGGATGWLDVFSGLTVGEAASETVLIRLGPEGGGRADLPRVPHPDAGLLARALAGTSAAVVQPRPLGGEEIATALRDGHIRCRFQPIVRMSDRRPVGVEVLARLDHPTRGTVPPGLFIPQLEQAGLSLHLTDAVFECCLRSLDADFLEKQDLFLSINLPLDALLLPEALTRVEERRAAAGIPSARMLIELTESVPVHDIPALAAAIDRWRSIGYRLAIDDLGPAVINQTMLVDMPFHTVKLDKQIVLGSRTDPLARLYLQRTVANARSRSLSIIAEGIEDPAMWERMAEMGVDQAQGFMIARPLPAAALPLWLDLWRDGAPQTGAPG